MQVLEFPKKDKSLTPTAFVDWVASEVRKDAEGFGGHCCVGVALILDEHGRVHVLRGGEDYTALAELGLYQVATDLALQRMHEG